MIHVMLDLETLGVSPDAMIVSIGAISWNQITKETKEFYKAIHTDKNVGTIDVSTVKWWMKQKDRTKEVFFDETAVSLFSALSEFIKFFPPDALLWSNGVDFDKMLLEDKYKRLGLPVPWKYWNTRCFRTFKNIIKVDYKIENGHNALDDARNQMAYLALGLK